jgi:methyl-accepting chemotaxis protein
LVAKEYHMRLSTITKVAYAATVGLTILSAGSLMLANSAAKAERKTYEHLLQSQKAAAELDNASDYLTNEARRYTIAGDKRHFDNYWREVNETQTRDHAVQRLKELGALDSELSLIEEAKGKSDKLIALEKAAMNAVAEGDLKKAQEIMFGEDYDAGKSEIMKPIAQFRHLLSVRTQTSLDTSRETAVTLMTLAQMIISLGTVSFLAILYAVFGRGVMDPLNSLRDFLTDAATDEGAREVPGQSRDDEIGEIARAVQKLKASAQVGKQPLSAAQLSSKIILSSGQP